MDYPRPAPVALTDVSPITQRRISSQLNPLGEYCIECGRSEDKELEKMHQLTDASAFAEASRRATVRRNYPMSYKQLISRPTLPNEALPWSYIDWQVAGDPGNAHLMEDLIYAKWPEWKPTENSMIPTQFLPPPLKCSKCDIGTSKLRRRQEDLLVANVYPQGIISPESAPELSSTYEKHYEQPSAVQSSMFPTRYPRNYLKDGDHEIRDTFSQNRCLPKGAKSQSIPIDESSTDTEAAVDSRAAPQMKEKPHPAAPRQIPEAMRVAMQRLAGRPKRARPSESRGTGRRQVEQQIVEGARKNEELLRNRPGKGKFEGVANIKEEFEKRSSWLSQAQLNALFKNSKAIRKASASVSSKENTKGLGAIEESVAGERTVNVASKSTSAAKDELEKPKPPSPPSPLSLDSERFRLKLPQGPILIEDVPEDDENDHQTTEQTCYNIIDSILAEKGLRSVTNPSDSNAVPCNSSTKIDSQEEKRNELKLAKSTEEAKVSGTETRVVTPNKGSPPNSPKTTFDGIGEDDDVEKCIAILSQTSVNDKNNEYFHEKDLTTEAKVDRDDLHEVKLKLISELTEQLVKTQSTMSNISAKKDVYPPEDTSAISTSFSLGDSSTTQNFIEESESKVSDASKSTSSRRDSHRKISNVVRKQVKYMRLGFGQLENLLSLQSQMMDESIESKQSNSGLA